MNEEVAAVATLCRNVLESDYPDIPERIADCPGDPDGWFKLLRGIPDDKDCVRRLGRLVADAEGIHAWPLGAMERYGVLQACLVALPRLASLPIDETITLHFCATLRDLAKGGWARPRNIRHDSDPFEELAKLVTVRRFHAGQSSFDIMAIPRNWLLRVHPLAVPGVLHEMLFGMGGLDPVIMPHLCHWRANPMMLLRKENDSAMLRIARTVELQPRIKGLAASSWLYSMCIGEISPHLAWVRNFYVDNGAYLVDMNLAPKRAGFMTGSNLRRRQYAEGKFRPRETLVLWRRQDLLAWAAKQTSGRDTATTPAKSVRVTKPNWRFDASKTLSSGRITLWDCVDQVEHRPRPYVFYVFLVPCMINAVLIAMTLGFVAVLPGVFLGIILIWILQYFLLQ
jgi:hypothetical protein